MEGKARELFVLAEKWRWNKQFGWPLHEKYLHRQSWKAITDPGRFGNRLGDGKTKCQCLPFCVSRAHKTDSFLYAMDLSHVAIG